MKSEMHYTQTPSLRKQLSLENNQYKREYAKHLQGATSFYAHNDHVMLEGKFLGDGTGCANIQT